MLHKRIEGSRCGLDGFEEAARTAFCFWICLEVRCSDEERLVVLFSLLKRPSPFGVIGFAFAYFTTRAHAQNAIANANGQVGSVIEDGRHRVVV